MKSPMRHQRHLRNRLRRMIHDEYGDVTTEALRDLAGRTGLSYTTLARFLTYEGKGSTRSLRNGTIAALSRVLDVRTDWLRDGQGSRQLGFWPRLDPADADALAVETGDLDDLHRVIGLLAELPPGSIRTRVCRAAVGACIDAAAREGVPLSEEVYGALVRLDVRLMRSNAGLRSA
jgi:hypothetical protein